MLKNYKDKPINEKWIRTGEGEMFLPRDREAEIAKLENLEVSQEEIGEAVALICRQNNMTMEQIKPYYDEEFEKALVKSVLTGKAMHLIREAAVITEV